MNDKTDQCIKQVHKQVEKQNTAGWDLEVEWRDGSTLWIALKSLKESNAMEVVEYAVTN